MRKIYILFALATLTACGNSASNDAAKTPKADTPAVGPATTKKETPPPPMDSATAAKKYMEYMTPGDMHKMLASSVGTWTSEYTMWEKENGPAQKSTGTCENKMILGGRYLQSTNKSIMMGMPFEGIGTMAYDNGRKVFIHHAIFLMRKTEYMPDLMQQDIKQNIVITPKIIGQCWTQISPITPIRG